MPSHFESESASRNDAPRLPMLEQLHRVQARLTVAEDALRAIADPSCGHIADVGDGLPSWDVDAGYKIARGAIGRLEKMA